MIILKKSTFSRKFLQKKLQIFVIHNFFDYFCRMKTPLSTLLRTTGCLLGMLCAGAAWSQQRLVLSLGDGRAYAAPVEEVDSLTFSAGEAGPSVIDLMHPSAYQQRQDKWYHHLENQGVADYLRDFDYPADDYSFHRLFDYRGLPYLDERQDQPYGVTLYWPTELAGQRQAIVVSEDRQMQGRRMRYEVAAGASSAVLYNLMPSRTYYYNIEIEDQVVSTARFETLGQLRMLRAEGLNNLRDLGGWPTEDGRHIGYGHLIRGVELSTVSTHPRASMHHMTEADRRMLLDIVGIGAELDLRSPSEIPADCRERSAMGPAVTYRNFPNFPYTNLSQGVQYDVKEALRFVMEEVQKGHAVYIHCVWGADRTGMLCMLIEGLLGATESSINKDYELTSFCGDTRYRTSEAFTSQLGYIKSLPGETLRDKFESYWLMVGISHDEIEHFRQLMLE